MHAEVKKKDKPNRACPFIHKYFSNYINPY